MQSRWLAESVIPHPLDPLQYACRSGAYARTYACVMRMSAGAYWKIVDMQSGRRMVGHFWALVGLQTAEAICCKGDSTRPSLP